ncbi:glycosyltransferase family 92 protein RCOM_0530710-like [Macadamia integrifolia]|uniref:glycosyltransferase family 92 protein RCOM_0530710-like n=1 Tax=Macadamia integrifolia TaxID=60698 RepID=UPI001C4EA9F2|nr:glycosyltransferase family 92 protein RCOM_0530710-like [Macadamia integrifolia]
MYRKNSTALLFMLVSVALFASFLFCLPRDFLIPSREIRRTSSAIFRNHQSAKNLNLHLQLAVATEDDINRALHHHLSSSSFADPQTVSILLPDWELLLILSPDKSLPHDGTGDPYYCLFQNNATSPAKPAGFLPSTNLTTFKCLLPQSLQRIRPIFQPILTKRREFWPVTESPELLRWGFLTYESFSTENDVILFAKGVNNRQGVNRSPSELRCVFGDDDSNGVITDVTSSSQEVFRCRHPDETTLARLSLVGKEKKIKISLQFQLEKEKKKVVPSVAYYTPPSKPAPEPALVPREGKSLLCACTMVYNVGRFLKEWVLYHSKLGVEKFFLYDNGSDDGLEQVVSDLLRRELYNNLTIETLLWPWPKTQEGGFSHCALQARDSCSWMIYIDVDEFIFSPSWINSSNPSTNMLRSLLPISSSSSSQLGQIGIRCLDFGPSNQRSNPVGGVTQGYTCRRRFDERHKSMVLLDAIDESLLNVIHHFRLKESYRGRWLSLREGVVNHYKYQAWPEFKTKFRRRVSAYVVDWREETNPNSKDRTPGLGFLPVEPEGWANKFCEVNDTSLQEVTKRWFGSKTRTGFKMAWEDE